MNKRKIKSLFKNQNGEIFYEVIIKTLVVVVLLLTSIGFYNIFIQYQNVNYLNRRLVRSIELEGAINSNSTKIFTNLKNELKIQDAKYSIKDVKYFDYTSKRIQLRDTFTIEVSSVYELEVFNPIFAPVVNYPITLTSTLTGMSEVYWK